MDPQQYPLDHCWFSYLRECFSDADVFRLHDHADLRLAGVEEKVIWHAKYKQKERRL